MADNLKTFTWKMNMGATASVKHNITKTQFGDGYAQRVSLALTTNAKTGQGQKRAIMPASLCQ